MTLPLHQLVEYLVAQIDAVGDEYLKETDIEGMNYDSGLMDAYGDIFEKVTGYPATPIYLNRYRASTP